jgi:hypothetical protein
LTGVGRRPDEKEGFVTGKSQTCRASEWQSHCSGHGNENRNKMMKRILMIAVIAALSCVTFHNLMLDQAGDYFRDTYGGTMVNLHGSNQDRNNCPN